MRDLRAVRSGNATRCTRFASVVERQNEIKKSFPLSKKIPKSKTFWDRILAFDSTGEKMLLGSRFPWEIFKAPVRARTLASNFISEFGIFRGLHPRICK